jgi:hypothetical protein
MIVVEPIGDGVGMGIRGKRAILRTPGSKLEVRILVHKSAVVYDGNAKAAIPVRVPVGLYRGFGPNEFLKAVERAIVCLNGACWRQGYLFVDSCKLNRKLSHGK